MSLRELAGQTKVIDASCWLQKGLSVSFAQTGRRDSTYYVTKFFLQVVKGYEAGSRLASSTEPTTNGKSYTVLWEIKPEDRAVTFLSNPQSAANVYLYDLDEECNEDGESDESEEAPEACASTSHCFPFKVLGTCYTAERQKFYEYLYEHNRPLFVKLKAEPDNLYDRNAIVFYIMASSEYKKVVYLALE
ncbi:hypothetical protein AWC38_SpisGene23039 [Stylophora pistillata]|uniref:Uncharacterized protein n=1 Tax=Stylophora pistillata TaxID=50429 RepID=A0A2B4R989_STYPI|nr:hypothetical protein AWC38_SpisGene23039 [Stylophora pistillata]